jgi:dihydroorotate dehydrogenase electron transfer subunit
MSDHVCCTSYADHASQCEVRVIENVQLARETFRIRFSCPEIAARILPGQFIMIRLAQGNDPLLGRPFALYDVLPDAKGKSDTLDIVYLVVGKMTSRLSELQSGAKLEVWGPLGNGFPAEATEHLIMVAGGIGQTPFLTLAKEYLGVQGFGDPPRSVEQAKKVSLCYGAKSAEYLAGLADFENLGVELWISTDDGSKGHHGLVTELIAATANSANNACRLVCCGPEPMLEATAKIAEKLSIPCQVSMENAMACGIGICFSCAVKIRDTDGGWDYRRTCVEGPVFDANDVLFH